jgi:hypothetical protein
MENKILTEISLWMILLLVGVVIAYAWEAKQRKKRQKP